MKVPVHLNALRAFEASARHQSFSLAAEELNVTPAAVGQLVRSLEEVVGFPLFHRSNNRRAALLLTELAQRALPDIRAGFQSLNLGMTLLREGATNGILNVTISPAFAAKWLLPRIEDFQQRWPDIDVRLETSLKLLDFTAQGMDVGIRYGLGHWEGLQAELLMSEEVFPVCAPSLMAVNPAINCLTGVTEQTLIHDLSMEQHKDFITWDRWLRRFNVQAIARKPGLRINSSAAVLQAAVEGHGIALARSIMVDEDLKSGRLVRLCPEVSLASPLAYYLVHRPGCDSLPKIAYFREWMIEQAQAFNNAVNHGNLSRKIEPL
ncbi:MULTISPECIES: transcriptional regulator GcvA [Klebsiella]|uniref:transcriptional regulator GcvA n=1 Tax=Klebsiella TaxID=570 RepID=UPI0007BE68D5|nr:MULTISPECIES: transcriptional regulator GcvA [Klebsiella]ARI11242.1 LysR family transcriptional regulator [Klebsiella sp. M5al]KZT46409.1 LysR family transcriptional regulator [Klebsiella michiganensis]